MNDPAENAAARRTGIDCDAAVIGGGLTGSICALALADAGLEVVLVDAADPAAMRDAAFDGRTTAIAYAPARMLRRLGLWEALAPGAEPIRDILVTDGRPKGRFDPGTVSPLHMHFDSRALDTGEPLGWIVENRLLRDVFYDAAEAHKDIRILAPARRTAFHAGPARARVDLHTGETVRAPLVVAADGRPSPLREEAGIKTVSWSYPQTSIVTVVAHERAHRGVAQELFLPAGPFAILPMTGNRSSLVWTEKSRLAKTFMALDDAAFTRAIADRFGPYLGEISAAGPRWSYPLSFQIATRTCAHRLALAGDAAHGIHPIAGQGYNLGLKDIAALAEVVGEAKACGLDIGDLSVLERYQRWRRFDSTMLAFGTDFVDRLFSTDLAPVRLARDLGIGAVNAAGPLRQFFMRQAGGDVGRLPRLMRA